VECGGSLLVLDATDPPRGWNGEFVRAVDGGTLWNRGFGVILTTATPAGEALPPLLASAAFDSWQQTRAPLSTIRSTPQANLALPVVEGLGIPVRGLFLLMLGFAMAIGPLSLVVLSRWNRRLWLLWTVPLVSLVTSASMFGWALAAEGFEVRTRIRAMTFLDQRDHSAATLGWLAFYPPVTPGGGLHFPLSSEVTAQVDTYGDPGMTTGRSIDWSLDQHLGRGWLLARVPAHFTLRTATLRRERLLPVRHQDGTVAVVNGLGAVVERLWLADHQGRVWQGTDIAPGARQQLAASPLKPSDGSRPEAPRSLLGADWTQVVDSVPSNPVSVLVPGRYLAVVSPDPFLATGLESGATGDSRGLVVGVLAEPSAEVDDAG
jgi:hypothetical protein